MIASSPLRPCSLHLLHGLQHALVILRHDLDELRHVMLFQSASTRAARSLLRVGLMPLDHLPHLLRSRPASASFSSSTICRLQRAGEIAGFVEHVGDAAGHAGRKVAPGPAQHDHAAAGHVFAAVIADGFDDRVDAAVAHAEPFARHAADERLRRWSRRKAPRCR